jgi:hypothetical protein
MISPLADINWPIGLRLASGTTIGPRGTVCGRGSSTGMRKAVVVEVLPSRCFSMVQEKVPCAVCISKSVRVPVTARFSVPVVSNFHGSPDCDVQMTTRSPANTVIGIAHTRNRTRTALLVMLTQRSRVAALRGLTSAFSRRRHAAHGGTRTYACGGRLQGVVRRHTERNCITRLRWPRMRP